MEAWKNCKFGKMWKSGKNLEIWEKFEISKKFGNLENIQIFGNGFDSIENLEII